VKKFSCSNTLSSEFHSRGAIKKALRFFVAFLYTDLAENAIQTYKSIG
jgi:hypothetical protein